MKLSIIIVSYNAWEFLDLTLHSVNNAISGIDCEVMVIDNASKGDILGKAKEKYPFITAIQNTNNLGFSKANNIGLKQAKGELALLLNPDIIVAEDTFQNIIEFYKQNPEAGGVGVKMINGSGHYLKESKRGLPTPLTSFYKVSGLCKLFPKSKKLARYYHGHLNIDQDHPVDILAGAFLVQQRNKSGNFELLDETYFMYGEDIDLSYCLQNKFADNYYLGSSPIIHFKGQTTPGNPEIYNYFYRAMWIFHKKYFHTQHSAFINGLIWVTIQLINQIKIWQLPFKSQHRNNFKAQKIIIHSIDDKLESYIKSTFPDAQTETMATLPGKLPNSCLILFDLKHIATKTVIQNMIKLGPHHYAFVDPSRDHLILNTINAGKGKIIPLKR